MRGPRLQAVKDVGGVDDGGAALLALLRQEGHQVRPAQHVEVDGDLIKQQNLVGAWLMGWFGLGLVGVDGRVLVKTDD